MSFSKKLRIRALAALGLLLNGVLIFAVVAWFVLTRDAGPRFEERYGELSGAERESAAEGEGFVTERWRLTSTSGLRCEMAVRTPTSAVEAASAVDAEPRPLVLILGGHRTGRDAVELLPPDDRFVVAALSYPYHGPAKPKGLEVATALPAIRGALLDAPPCLRLTLDHLLPRPSVDSGRVEMLGVSLGAPLAVITGALDERISRVWSIHGGGDLPAMLAFNLPEEVQNPFLGPPAKFVGGTLLAQLQPELYAAEVAPRPLVMINAEDDERIPRSCVASLYAAAREPKELLWVEGEHVGPRRQQVLTELLRLVLPRIAAGVEGGPQASSSLASPSPEALSSAAP
ncbi:MAG: hypothetical protein SX243_18640 [Acidobacteriota bacterium]|nr:hypothetical protein [Acidobacteriota bacterium]